MGFSTTLSECGGGDAEAGGGSVFAYKANHLTPITIVPNQALLTAGFDVDYQFLIPFTPIVDVVANGLGLYGATGATIISCVYDADGTKLFDCTDTASALGHYVLPHAEYTYLKDTTYIISVQTSVSGKFEGAAPTNTNVMNFERKSPISLAALAAGWPALYGADNRLGFRKWVPQTSLPATITLSTFSLYAVLPFMTIRVAE